MAYFIKLSFQYMKKHKSRTLYSLFCIMVTFILCFLAFTAGYSVWDYNLKVLYHNNGETQLFIDDSPFTKKELEQVKNYASVRTLRILDNYAPDKIILIEETDESTEYRLEVGLWDTSNLQNSVNELQKHLGITFEIDEDVATFLNQGDTLASYLYHACVVIVGALFAVFSIFILRNTMMISIVERMKDYGLLRCVGMSRKQLYQLLVAEGLLMGVCAVIGGVGCGYGFLFLLQQWLNCEFHFPIPFEFGFYPKAVLYTALLCIAVTLFSMLEPARQVGMISPIEAIHNNITMKKRRGRVNEELQHHSGRLWGMFFGVEGEYAYKNMLRNRGRFIYLFIGLIVCIVLLGTMFSFTDSTYATIKKAYQGKRKEFAEVIGVNTAYDIKLVGKIRSDLDNMDGIKETGLVLRKTDVRFSGIKAYDSKLINNSIDICLHYGYDKEHLRQLKPYLLEGSISFENMTKEHGVILCDMVYNMRDKDGNITDYRLTDYKTGDTISLLSTKGKTESMSLFREAIQTAADKTGIKLPKKNEEYSKEDPYFDEILKETLRILAKKGFDCEEIKKISDYESMGEVTDVLFQIAYNKGERDNYVILGIISEDIYNGSETTEYGGNVISILHLDSEFLTSFNNQTSDSVYSNYSWYIGFNQEFPYDTDIENYCKMQSKNGIEYNYNSIITYDKNVMETLHISKVIVFLISGCIAFISIVQVFNTVCANMSLRQKELRTYTIVGMSKKQKMKMIILENGVATVLAVIVGYLIAWGFSWYFVEHLLNQDNSINYIWPWFKMAIVSVVLIIIIGVVSVLGTVHSKD